MKKTEQMMMDEVEQDYRKWRREREEQELNGPTILQAKGADHYKTGSIEPFDLFRAGGMLIESALTSIIRYAFRCRPAGGRSTKDQMADMDKIIHYAEVVKEELKGGE